MKTIELKMWGLASIVALLMMAVPVQAKKYADYTTISGVVKDRQTKKKLEYVNIAVMGTSIGTVTNVDGGFAIKVPDSIQAQRLEISYLGYKSQILPFAREDMEDVEIFLIPNANKLPEVVVRAMDPLRLVKEAVSKVAVNNSNEPNRLTGFYRETVKKRRSYINVTEAIVDIYKTSYAEDVDRDRIQIRKGRQLVSPKAGDTLVVKLQGGPTAAIYGDAVKNRELIFGNESLKDYKFKMERTVMLDNRSHYVVSFEPQRAQPYPLFYGTIYIDEATLSFTQIEYSLNMKDRNKIVNAILKKKPFNLRFKPEEITYMVTYRMENGRSYLNYMRNDIRFKCDWKRRLFSTNYEVVSEMVITDKVLHNATPIPAREAFGQKSILSDKVSNFYDEDFWEGYNIIAPTESLESAVNKLKKQHNQ